VDVLLVYAGVAVVAYWFWAKSKGRESPLIVDGLSGVAVISVGVAMVVAGIMLGTS
jgi:hypothetical protein